MELSTGWTELNNAMKTLRAQWENLRTDWHDQAQQEFEGRYWDPLQANVAAALRGMDRLAPLLAKARNECS